LDRRFELLYVRILPEKSLRHATPTFFINPHPVTIAQFYFNRLLGFRASEARKGLLNARVSGSSKVTSSRLYKNYDYKTKKVQLVKPLSWLTT
jgi:hypothetical protein